MAAEQRWACPCGGASVGTSLDKVLKKRYPSSPEQQEPEEEALVTSCQ